MAELTNMQKKNWKLIHFHLVDLKNTINDPRYKKEDYLRILESMITFVKYILQD